MKTKIPFTLAERQAHAKSLIEKNEREPIERITSAAIKNGDGTVFTGFSHADVRMDVRNERVYNGKDVRLEGETEGFVTSKGEFVDRDKAAYIAWNAGQTDEYHPILKSHHLILGC